MKLNTMPIGLMFMLWLQVYYVEAHWFLPGRRRRRRAPIPPAQDCTYNSWGSWGSCSNYCSGSGVQIKTRTIRTKAKYGGGCTYDLQRSRSCGSLNNGCTGPSVQCKPNDGSCSCSNPGYKLVSKKCKDKNECAISNNKGPCDHICTNTPGSYKCSCNRGYSLSGQHACSPKDCSAITVPVCPLDSYQDNFSKVCQNVAVSCPSGTLYRQFCTLSCPNDYRIGKITQQSGQKFGQDYANVDFASVKTTPNCSLQQSGSGVTWDIARQDIGSYYCRRNNDPPSNITLSGNKLPEHSPSGYVVGTLSSVDSQSSQSFTYMVQSPSILFTCQGSKLVSTWRDPDLHGVIHLTNGIIKVKVRSKDNGSPQMWLDKTFLIEVINVNDPPINITLSNREVHENASIGDVVGSLKAVDEDDPPGTPPSSNFIWVMTNSDNGKFAINKSQVVVAQKLDHEVQKVHKITVSSTDRGQPPQTNKKDFLIAIIDVNELPKTIILSKTSVPENSAIGTVVGFLKAIDEDNDAITFSISQSSAVTQSKFNLSTTTCSSVGQSETCTANVKVIGELDYEDVSSYQLIVVASDKSGQVIKQWTISVTNVNEKPTNITLTGSHTVNELSSNGTVVGLFKVTDPDNKNSITQTHVCVLVSGDKDYFTITANTVLQVPGTKVVDYETKSSLSITVKCTDTGNPSLSLSQNVVITVKDVNEAPTSLTLSKLEVPENSPNGTLVGKLSSSDPEKAYQNYTYSILGPKHTPFMLGGQGNRDVLVNGPLNFEETPKLYLTVRVSDSAGLYKDETFEIRLKDMNDPPTDIKLPGQNGKLTIDETSQKDVLISQINLVDQDTKDVATDCWLVDSAGGRVEIWKSVPPILKVGPTLTDYEKSDKVLKIILNCSDGHGKYVAQSFDVKIIDMNEKPTSIKLSNNTVPENQANAVVGVITVKDPDIGQSHRCTVCDVAQGGACSTSQYFEVNGAMELKTKKALNFELQHVHHIKISCSDIVSPPQTALSLEKPFTVIVTDLNEAPSSLCDTPYKMSIHDSIGAVIDPPLKAVDPDNEGNNKQALTYSMDNHLNGGVFQLKETHIFKNKEIPTPRSYNLVITVTDNGRVVSSMPSNGYIYTKRRPLSTVFNCTVTVTDSKSSEEIRLSSNVISVMALDGATVGTFTTIGGSLGESYSYHMLNNILQPFKIVGDKLIVKQTEVPEFHFSSDSIKVELFEYIEVQSTDSKNKKLKKLMYIRITNDAPSIPMCLVKQSISEKQPVQTIVGQVLIEESKPPKYSCSKTSCCSQVDKIPSGTFKYKCRVNNPDSNSVLPQSNNITAMFYVDNRYLLRSKVSFNYQDYVSTKGTIIVLVTCHDLLKPLHIIWKKFTIHIRKCSDNGNCPNSPECARCSNGGSCLDKDQYKYSCICSKGFTGKHCEIDIDYCEENPCKYGSKCHDTKITFKCECVTGYSGVLCDRKENLCRECRANTLCVKFVGAGESCLSSEYQIPLLVPVEAQELTAQQLLQIEQEVAGLVEQNIDKEPSKTSVKRKRRATSQFYVETLKTDPISDKSTLLYLAIMDGQNGYQPLMAQQACHMLSGTSRHCMTKNDCGAIEESGKTCPVIGTPKAQSGSRGSGLSDGGVSGVALVVVFLILALAIGAVFYYRRKSKMSKQHDRQVVYSSNNDNGDFNNPVYEEGNTNNDVAMDELARDRLAKDELVGHNLDPTSVKKRNDIKVTENVLYRSPDGQAISAENPTYVAAGAESRVPKKINAEEKPANNIDPKTGKEFSVSLDDDDVDDLKGHALKGHAMKGHAMKGHAKGSSDAAIGDKLDTKDKSRVTIPREERRPRYKENPSVRFSKRKEDRQYENPDDFVVKNPLYDAPTDIAGLPGTSTNHKDHVYENVVKQPEDINKGSIINPLYDLVEENPHGTGDLAANFEEPIYEVIPAKRQSASKVKRRSFARSLSLENSAGYEELQKDQNNKDEKQDDNVFSDSHA